MLPTQITPDQAVTIITNLIDQMQLNGPDRRAADQSIQIFTELAKVAKTMIPKVPPLPPSVNDDSSKQLVNDNDKTEEAEEVKN